MSAGVGVGVRVGVSVGGWARRVAAAGAAALAGLMVFGAAPAVAAPGPVNAPEYWFDSWHLEQSWAAGARGQGVVIAEIDTGVNANLAALSGRVLPGKDFGPDGGNGQIDRDRDEFGHGTAMASIMVGRPSTLGITGIAPDARVLPIALPLSGTTDAGADDHLAAAIRWAVDHGAKVVSMALGGARNPKTSAVPCPADEQAAVYYALSKGAVLLAAAGNQGDAGNEVEEPGVCLGVVSVGAVDRSGTVAPFSSRHRYVTVTAPGVDIPSLGRVPGTAYAGRGTSQATAIASAVTALVWSKYPGLDGTEVIARILATLDGRRATPSPSYGYGIVNAYRALTASVPQDAANPVWAAAEPFAARDGAFARPLPAAPAPAAPERSAAGRFTIGPAPGSPSGRTALGLVLGACGLVALGALALRPGRARRHHERLARAAAPVRRYVDPDGLEWHEIVEGRDAGATGS